MKPETVNWISKEKRSQFNTNANAVKINNPELDSDTIYEIAKKQVDKGFELYPDKVESGTKPEELI